MFLNLSTSSNFLCQICHTCHICQLCQFPKNTNVDASCSEVSTTLRSILFGAFANYHFDKLVAGVLRSILIAISHLSQEAMLIFSIMVTYLIFRNIS